MKELIPRGGYIRILFRFDPRRIGILLVGGDKHQLWDEWYKMMIPLGEKLYEDADGHELSPNGVRVEGIKSDGN